MDIRNYTPHSVAVLSGENTIFDTKTKSYKLKENTLPNYETVFLSVGVARCSVTEKECDPIVLHDFDGTEDIVTSFPTIEITFGEIEGLPEPEEGIYYIVSAIVANAARAKGRTDVLVPSRMVRDKDGNILGCLAFAIK